jgi:hypothetical protein
MAPQRNIGRSRGFTAPAAEAVLILYTAQGAGLGGAAKFPRGGQGPEADAGKVSLS